MTLQRYVDFPERARKNGEKFPDLILFNRNDFEMCLIASHSIHLQEGLPCLIAAYTFVEKLLQLFGFTEYSINGESTRPYEVTDMNYIKNPT